jgi:hypothetical protein
MDWGTHEMVDPYVIVVDHKYQREQKPGLQSKIAAGFDPMLFGRPICFKRNDAGIYYCIDGQQRIGGVKQLDPAVRSIPVITFPLVGVEREAEVFVRINETRKSLTGLEKHRGKIVAKDPAALQIERAVQKAGFSVGMNHQSPRAISAVGALAYANDRVAEDGIVQILTVMRESWGDDRKALDGVIIRTLADIIEAQSNNGGYKRSLLIKGLQRTSPAQILRESERLHFEHGTTKAASVRNAFKSLAKV